MFSVGNTRRQNPNRGARRPYKKLSLGNRRHLLASPVSKQDATTWTVIYSVLYFFKSSKRMSFVRPAPQSELSFSQRCDHSSHCALFGNLLGTAMRTARTIPPLMGWHQCLSLIKIDPLHLDESFPTSRQAQPPSLCHIYNLLLTFALPIPQ